MTAGIIIEYKHFGRTVSLPYNGPLEDGDFENVQYYFKWKRDLIKPRGLASYSYRMAHTRWHLAASGGTARGTFETPHEAREFFARYSKPQVFLAVNPELIEAMRREIKGEGPPHQLEVVTEKNGLVNMRLYYYEQLDGDSPKGARVHTWWPGHVYFDYRKFLQDHKNWTVDCSVKREAQLNKKQKKSARRGGF